MAHHAGGSSADACLPVIDDHFARGEDHSTPLEPVLDLILPVFGTMGAATARCWESRFNLEIVSFSGQPRHRRTRPPAIMAAEPGR